VSYSLVNYLQTSLGWSKRLVIAELPGFQTPDHYINTSTSVHTRDNRLGAIYAFNYDVIHSAMLQQRISMAMRGHSDVRAAIRCTSNPSIAFRSGDAHLITS
jgi:hypothetical protein